MPKRRDESQVAFDALQELIRRDAKRDGVELPPEPEGAKGGGPGVVNQLRHLADCGGVA